MKKILITGATGFAGKHLLDYLYKSSNVKIFGTSINEPNIDVKENISLIKVNLLNKDETEKLISSILPDEIYHLAALASPGLSFQNPTETITNNINVQINLLESLKKNNLNKSKILIISSAEIYGKTQKENLPMNESTPLRPLSPYAVSKIAQDFLALQYFLAHKFHIIRVRPFNHTGPGQAPVFVVAAFAKQIAQIEKGILEPYVNVGKLDAKRDFTDVRDMVKAYSLAIEKGIPGDVYNIGSDISYSIKYVLDTLISLSKVKVEVKIDPSRIKPIDTPELLCDSEKFRSLTNWKPNIKFEQTLKDTLDYWRNQF